MTNKVSVILPVKITQKWQEKMTNCCISTMRCTTELPYELILIESGSECFKYTNNYERYLHHEIPIGYSKEFNQAIEQATGDYIVHIGNDVFTRPGWLEAMVQCFEIPDCGAATLASSDMKHQPANKIMEGVYCPIMMLRKEDFKFSEDEFPDVFNDSDMIMRLYANGKRMYRNWNVVVIHLIQQTYSQESKESREEKYNKAKQLFTKKYENSPLLMYRVFTEGWCV